MKLRHWMLLFLVVLPCPAVFATQVTVQQTSSGSSFHHIPLPQASEVAIHISWPSNWPHSNRAAAAPYIAAGLLHSGDVGIFRTGNARRKLEALGANVRFYSRADAFHASISAPSPQMPDVIDVISQILAKPPLRKRTFNNVKRDLLDSISNAQRDPANRVADSIRGIVHESRSLLDYLTLRPLSMIEQTTMATVQAWFADTLSSTNAIVAVAGNAEVASAGQWVEALLEQLPTGTSGTSGAVPATNPGTGTLAARAEFDAGLPVTMLGAAQRLPALSDGGEMEDLVIMNVLGNNPAPVLATALSAHGYKRHIARTLLLADTSGSRALVIAIEADAVKFREIEQLVANAWDNFLAMGPDNRAVQIAKARIHGTINRSLRTPATAARIIVDAIHEGLNPARAAGLLAELDAVTTVSVKQRLSAIYLPYSRLLHTVISPEPHLISTLCAGSASVIRRHCVLPSD